MVCVVGHSENYLHNCLCCKGVVINATEGDWATHTKKSFYFRGNPLGVGGGGGVVELNIEKCIACTSKDTLAVSPRLPNSLGLDPIFFGFS